MASPIDPYRALGIDPSATDAQVRAAHRRLAQLHHPDHNGGSAEAARRFELIQEAYAEIRRRRARAAEERTGAAARTEPGGSRTGPTAGTEPGGARTGPAAGTTPTSEADPPAQDPELDARLAEIERDLRAARDAREQALREARGRARADPPRRPSDEELGYFTTDDSFSSILDDAAAQVSDRLRGAARSPAAHRFSALIDELAAKLTGRPPEEP